MNYPTDREVLNAIDDVRVEVEQLKLHDGSVLLQVNSMYERVDLKFGILDRLSALYGTNRIDVGEGVAETGCESCDYGSCYGWKLTIRP